MNIQMTLLPLALCASILAQDPNRRDGVQLPSTVTTDGVDQVSAPKENLPAQAGVAGSVHTGQLVHAVWLGVDGSGVQTLWYRRSASGGCDFGAAEALWTVQPGEDVIDADFHLVCHGHEVYVILTTDRDSTGAPSGGDDHVWVIGSDRQGLAGTWSTLHVGVGQENPLSNGDQHNDIDAPFADAVDGSLHCVWEVDYVFANGAGNGSGQEDVVYQRVDWVAPGQMAIAFPEEVQMESTGSGLTDTDFPRVVAKGDVVIVSWQDCRAAGPLVDDNLWNDSLLRVSTNGGASFDVEQNLTNFAAPMTFANQRETKVLIWGQSSPYSVGVFFEDSRNGEDDIFFALSGSNGVAGSFVPTVQISLTPAGVDSDGMEVCATDEGRIYVTYEDNRQDPSANSFNRVFVLVDQNGGGDFLQGTHTETEISLGDASTPPQIDCYGNYAAVTFVDNIAGTDPAVAVYTYDNGSSWNYQELFDRNGVDADQNATCAVTTRGDVCSTWMDDRNGGNAFNNVFAGGLRVSSVAYDVNLPGYVVRGAGEPGDTTILLLSLTAPSCGALQLQPANGWQSNFAADGLTFGTLSLPVIFTTTTAQREALYPFLPNVATLLGLPAYASAVSYDASSVYRAMTDTATL